MLQVRRKMNKTIGEIGREEKKFKEEARAAKKVSRERKMGKKVEKEMKKENPPIPEDGVVQKIVENGALPETGDKNLIIEAELVDSVMVEETPKLSDAGKREEIPTEQLDDKKIGLQRWKDRKVGPFNFRLLERFIWVF